MKLHLLFVLFGCGLAWFVLSSRSGGLAATSNQDRSGSPVSSGQCSNCHSGGSFGAQAAITVKDGGGNTVSSYIPGNSYTVEIVMSGSGAAGYGTQLSILDASNSNAGTFGSVITSNTQISTIFGRSLLEHSGISSTGIFQANWTAPVAGTGTVTLYGNGIAANANGGTSGDQGSAIANLSLSEAVATTISYAQSSYCTDGTDPSPTQTGTTGGTYSTSLGLSVDPNTGVINLSGSIQGTYTVTYTYSGGSTTTTVTINEVDQATISYPTATYCANDAATASPSVAGTGGGTFSSSLGLSINPVSGIIDLSNSTAGSYTVTYVTNGPCPTTATTSFTVDPRSDASFSYGGASFCISNPTNPLPTITGDAGGVFSSSNNGLDINSSTGEIDLSISNPGNYDVTYIVGGSCPDTLVLNVDIVTAGDASFSYDQSLYCSDNDPELPDVTGNPGGVFSASSNDISLDVNTGEIDPGNSLAGTYDISYVVGAGNCSDSQVVSVQIAIIDSAEISYSDTIFCLNGTNPTPNISGMMGGQFTSSTTDIEIDVSSGEINLANSLAGSYSVQYNTTGTCPTTAFFDVELQVCGSVNINKFSTLKIHPNPSSNGIFYLQGDQLDQIEAYEIYNSMGQLIQQENWNQQSDIQLRSEVKGLYYLRVYGKNDSQTFRLILQ